MKEIDPELIRNEELIREIKKRPTRLTGRFDIRIAFTVLLLVVLGGLAILVGRLIDSTSPLVVSEEPIHWHAKVFVYKSGQYISIPGGIGLSDQIEHPETLHTHGDDNNIHMEISSPVLAKQVMLTRFFEAWSRMSERQGKDFGEVDKLIVNGSEVADGLKYVMRDHDEISVYFK
ncbi:MAG TPA: hypothetical protein VJJ22_00270 [Candidatus Paceibacterota bacterium]